MAFTLLTIIGSVLIFAAVPFKVSGNNIVLFWMIAAEVLLAAGIIQKEVLFRRIGLLGGVVTSLLVGYEASGIIDLRQHSDAPRVEDGVLLLTCAALFYFNAQFLRRKWKDLFTGFEDFTAILQGYLGCLTAFLGAWAIFTSDWTAIAWAMLMLAAACGVRRLNDRHMLVQSCALAAIQTVTINLFTDEKWRGVDLRLITVATVVAVLYAMACWVRLPESARKTGMQHIYTWVASDLAAWMLWSELQPIGVALGIAVFGLLLFEWGEWRQTRQLRLQGYVAMAAAFGRIFFVNLTAATLPGEWLSPRIYSVAPLTPIYFYVWSRLQSAQAKPEIRGWQIRDLIAYFGSASLAALLYYEAATEWVIVGWAVMTLVFMAVAWLLNRDIFLEHAVRLFPTQVASALASSCQGRTELAIVSKQQHNDPFNRPELRYWAHVVSFLVSNHELNWKMNRDKLNLLPVQLED